MGSTGPRNLCLTMHQPWGSLLVAGVKRVEGRSWPTDHRGKLWIHAAAKEPSAEEVRAVEDQYRIAYAAEGITGDLSLPTSYPTSCLLGCVEIVDCLPQLVLPFSLLGYHKLWKMDKHTREAAEQGLEPVANGPSPVVFRSS